MVNGTDNKAIWPGWETVRVIGRGSFGAVYEIQRDVFGEKEKAALKVITIPQSDTELDELIGEGLDDQSITDTFKSFLKSIVAEYSLMRKMNGSANVVNCDDMRYIQHSDGFGWDILIKMELLTPLKKAVGKDIPEDQVIRIGTDLCKALILCKKHSIVHRDIKPANVFVSENGDYKLGDFGIAKTMEKTIGGTKTGTYEYMAPEVYHDEPYGSTVDIYSLGMVLYWLLNERRTPFLKLPPEVPTNSEREQARKRRFSGEQIPSPAHGSEPLRRIVLKACAYCPENRYQSAEEMLRDLEILSLRKKAEANPEDVSDTTMIEGAAWEEFVRKEHERLSREEAARPERDVSRNAEILPVEEKKPAAESKQKPPAVRDPKQKRSAALIIAVICLLAFIMGLSIYLITSKSGKSSAVKPVGTAAVVDESKAEPLSIDAQTGSYVVFGTYEQDNDLSNGPEPIEWLVLSKQGDRLLVISRYVLDCQSYNEESKPVTWEECSLRNWLNDTFPRTAFTYNDLQMISLSSVSADRNPEYSTDPGNSTEDMVFLLSIEEADRYFLSDETRKCSPTEYAVKQGASPSIYHSPSYPPYGYGPCWWWLRSPGASSNLASIILHDGSFSFYSRVDSSREGIRPAMWIDLGN